MPADSLGKESSAARIHARAIETDDAVTVSCRLFKSVFDWGFESQDEQHVTGDGIYLCRGKVTYLYYWCYSQFVPIGKYCREADQSQ